MAKYKAISTINHGFLNKDRRPENRTLHAGDVLDNNFSDADIKALKDARVIVDADAYDRFHEIREDRMAAGAPADVASADAHTLAVAESQGTVSETTDPARLREEMAAAAKGGAFQSTDPNENPPVSQSHTGMDEQVVLSDKDVTRMTGQATGNQEPASNPAPTTPASGGASTPDNSQPDNNGGK